MWQPLEILNVFTTLTLKQIFCKTKTFFKKLEHRFLVKSAKIESATFPHKTALPEANFKTNYKIQNKYKTIVQNGPIKKNGVLPVTTLFLWKFCFSVRTFSKEMIKCTNYPNVYIHTFRKRWSLIWRCFFPVSIWYLWNSLQVK